MRFLRSKPAEPTNASEFWSWWARTRERLGQAIDKGSPGPWLISEITAHVQKTHPQMAWELAPGTRGKVVVTTE